MFAGIALVALMAQAHSPHAPVATLFSPAAEDPGPPGLAMLPTRLKLDVSASEDMFVSDRLWTTFKRAALGLRIEGAPTSSRPDWMPGVQTSNGFLAARIGHGLYLSHAPMPRAELFPYRDYIAAKPGPLKRGPAVGMDASFFFTKTLGIRVDVSAGSSTFVGLSLIYRPTKW